MEILVSIGRPLLIGLALVGICVFWFVTYVLGVPMLISAVFVAGVLGLIGAWDLMQTRSLKKHTVEREQKRSAWFEANK